MTKNVLIIGAGMAGLTAVAYLSRTGLKVDVYEQHTLPGGHISTFVREGFTFPAVPTSITSNGIVFPILKELGLVGKRKFLHSLSRWSGQHWAWTGTLALGIVLLTFLAVQAVMIGFSAGIQHVMVVNGLALLGSALWPSVRNAYRDDN